MKVLSMNSVYALRALLYITAQKNRLGYVGIREISEKLDISFHFLTKILQTLTQHGILRSYRGPSGGVALERDPASVSLLEVVYLFEGEDFFKSCILGLPGCGERQPCPLHDFWQKTSRAVKQQFETTFLEGLTEKVLSEKLRLSPCE